MFALSLALLLGTSPLQTPPEIDGVIDPAVFDASHPPDKPKLPEILPQQLPFAQFNGYEPALILLDSDPLLVRKVSIKADYITVRRLLSQISDKETILQVNGEITDLRIMVALRNRPLSVVMREVARMLPGLWEKEKDSKTYTLFLTGAAQKYSRDWWSIWQEEQQRARKELQTHVLNFLKADPYKTGKYNPAMITNDASIVVEGRADRAILHQLPDAVHQRLAKSYSDHMIYGRGYGGERVEGSIVVPYSDLPNAVKDTLDRRFATWFAKNAPNANHAMLRLSNMGTLLGASLTTGKEKQSTGFHVNIHPIEAIWTLSPDHFPRLKDYIKGLGDKAPPRWNDLEKYTDSVVWKTPEIKRPSPLWHQAHLSDVLNRFAEEKQIEYIAECRTMPYDFSKSPKGKKGVVRMNFSPPAKQPDDFDTMLPVLSASADNSWRKTDNGIYLIRGNRWYRQDAAILPEIKSTAWRKTLETNKVKVAARYAPTSLLEIRQMLDLDSEIATTLTKWQITKGLRFFSVEVPADPAKPDGEQYWIHPFDDMASRLQQNYYMLQWYAGLDDGLRTRLIEQRLPVAALNPQQYRQVEYLLPDIALLDRNNPLFLGVRAESAAPVGGMILDWAEGGEGGYDSRTGVELFLIQPTTSE